MKDRFMPAIDRIRLTLACTALFASGSTLLADAHHNGTAYPTIQAAVNAASPGDLVEVDPGTYTGVGDSVLDFGDKPITVRATGGPHVTFIDGQGVRRGVRIAAPAGGALDATLEGFTVLNGSATDHGGGVLMSGGSQLHDCRILDSSAPLGGGVAIIPDDAGGLRTVDLIDVSIVGNRSTGHGGGLALSAGGGPGNLELRLGGAVSVLGNSASGRGGGVYVDTATIGLLARSGENGLQIVDNRSEGTGGGLHARGSEVDLDGSFPVHIAFNVSEANGGGCALVSCPVARVQLAEISDNEALGDGSWGGGLWVKDGSCELVAVELEGNVAGGGGGAIRTRRSDVTLIGCRLDGNEALRGGGGGFSGEESANTVLIDTVVSGNRGFVHGGGLHLYHCGALELLDCTIRDNAANAPFDPDHTYGGGAWVQSTRLHASGNEWHRNSAGYGGGLYAMNFGAAGGSGPSVIESELFADNRATYTSGGAIGLNGDGAYALEGCEFRGNQGNANAISAGGNLGVTIDVTGCRFLGHGTSGLHGIATAVKLTNATATIGNSVFRGYSGKAVSVLLAATVEILDSCFCDNGTGISNDSSIASCSVGGSAFSGNAFQDMWGTWTEIGFNQFPTFCPCGSGGDCDITGDGVVDGTDLAALLGAWGTAAAHADLDGNGRVDGGDLAILLGCWN